MDKVALAYLNYANVSDFPSGLLMTTETLPASRSWLVHGRINRAGLQTHLAQHLSLSWCLSRHKQISVS
jgi:hypothetical protein